MRSDADALADPAVRKRLLRLPRPTLGPITDYTLFMRYDDNAAAIIVYHLEVALLAFPDGWLHMEQSPDGVLVKFCRLSWADDQWAGGQFPSRLEGLLAACETMEVTSER